MRTRCTLALGLLLAALLGSGCDLPTMLYFLTPEKKVPPMCGPMPWPFRPC